MLCSHCNQDTDTWYTEWIYFRKTGETLCQKCYDRHCTWLDPIYHVHICCQDFKDMNGEWVHFNMPITLGDLKDHKKMVEDVDELNSK